MNMKQRGKITYFQGLVGFTFFKIIEMFIKLLEIGGYELLTAVGYHCWVHSTKIRKSENIFLTY